MRQLSGLTFQLYDRAGHRKFLTAAERTAFFTAAEHADRRVRTFRMTLAFTGSRISEALHLTADRVDLTGRVILFENPKKPRTNSYRRLLKKSRNIHFGPELANSPKSVFS